MAIGEQIRKRRRELNLSRSELAEQLHVTPSAVANYENGVSYPKPEIFILLMDALNVDANYLFSDSISHSLEKKLTGSYKINSSDSKILEHYFALPDRIKELINTMIETEYKAYRTTVLPLYSLNSKLSKQRSIQAEALHLPPSTEFCIQLDTDSYLPFYKKNEILAFSGRKPKSGDIALFKIDSCFRLMIVHCEGDRQILSPLNSSDKKIITEGHTTDCLGVFLDKIYGQHTIQ